MYFNIYLIHYIISHYQSYMDLNNQPHLQALLNPNVQPNNNLNGA